MAARFTIPCESGAMIDLLAPDARHIRLRDIAGHLARINRWTGAAAYSVAQHSIHVADLLGRWKASPLTQMRGLLHDAHEAYMGDISAPLRGLLAGVELESIEARLDSAIMRAFGLAHLDDDDRDGMVGRADDALRNAEWRDLLPHAPALAGGAEAAPFAIRPWTWLKAENEFHNAFRLLAQRAGLKPLQGAMS